jgi:hypothetical protein
MKKLILVATFAFVSIVAFSQSPIAVGSNQLNVGVGLSEWGVPVYIGLDHGISRDLTLGAEFSYRSYNEKWNNNKYDHNIMGFSGNLNYHFNSLLSIPHQWDVYVGPNLGFYVWDSPSDYNGNESSGLGLGAQLGFRYFLSDKIALNLELGSGNAFSGGKFGLTFKL